MPGRLAPDELTAERAEELLAQPAEGRELGIHPETGRAVVVRTGRYGPYVTEELEEGSDEKPRTASLFKTMSPETVTLDDAVRLLVAAARRRRRPGGRRGDRGDERPLRARSSRRARRRARSRARSSCSRSRSSRRSRCSPSRRPAAARGAAKPPLRSSAPIPRAGRPIVVKEGRFGPLRHGRRDEREPPRRRDREGSDARPGGRAARRAARQGPGGPKPARRRRALDPKRLQSARTTSERRANLSGTRHRERVPQARPGRRNTPRASGPFGCYERPVRGVPSPGTTRKYPLESEDRRIPPITARKDESTR